METIITHRSISTHATRGSQARSLAPYVTYPLVLAANAALVTWALWTGASLESVTAAGLLATIVALFVLERVMPHQRAWHPNRKEALRDFFYFGLNGALDSATKLGTAFAVATIGTHPDRAAVIVVRHVADCQHGFCSAALLTE